MSEEERIEVATIISSILTSNPMRTTIRQLDNEFRNTVGSKIPYQKFGCNSLEHFLRTLKDRVEVYGSGINAEVEVIVNERIAHINNLVAKQRIAKQKSPRYFNRRPQARNRRNFSFHTYNEKKSTSVPTSQQNIKTEIKSDIQNTSHNGAIPKQLTGNVTEVEEIFFSDDEYVHNVKVPEHIQDNLKKLIFRYPDGILCSNILEVYRKEYGNILNYSEYGYRCIAQMCVDLRNIFNIIQLDKTDIKLFDKNRPIPDNILNIVKKLQLMKIKASIDRPTENALPDTDVEELMDEIYNTKLPPDIVELGINLEKQWINPGANEQDYIDVNVAEVYDPSKFWINLKIYANQLNCLMDSMQIFYGIHKNELQVPYLALRKGMYVVCLFSKEYHRARIIDTLQKQENVVKVYFIDYGTVSVISIEGICYLHKQFSELPEQGIRARLAGIYPTTENEQWSRTASTKFLNLIMQKDLVAQIIRIDEERKILDVVLADTSDRDEDFFINDALVAMGCALFTFQQQNQSEPRDIVPIVRYIHLFPTHMELESGLLPSSTQMISMHHAGLRIEQIYPHYFKDRKTGSPISITLAFTGETPNLTVDHEMEQPYYENSEVNTSDNRVEYRWKDIIEKDELNASETYDKSDVVQNVSRDVTVVESENNLRDSRDVQGLEKNYSTYREIEEFIKENGYINKDTESEKNFNNTACSMQYNNVSNFPPNNCNCQTSQPHTTQKPLTPPPGFYTIKPQNITFNYNHIPYPNFGYFPASQTYFNFPLPYCQPIVPQYFNYPNFYKNVMDRIQYLIQQGARLTPEQQNYLQKFSGCNSNFPIYGNCENYKTHGETKEDFTKVNFTQEFSNPCKSLTKKTNPNDDRETWGSIADQLDNPQSTSQYVQVDLEVDSFKNVTKIQNNKSFNKEYSEVKAEGEEVNAIVDFKSHEHCSETVLVSKKQKSGKCAGNQEIRELIDNETQTVNYHSDIDVYIDKQPSINLEKAHVSIDNVSKKEDDEVIATSIDYHSSIDICSDLTSEIESFYEDCNSKDTYFIEKVETCLTGNISEQITCVIPIDIGKVNMHVIKFDGEYYFLLSELSKKIFGKSLTAVQIRKLSVGMPYLISVVDIRLRPNPEMKKQLLKYDLITENARSVDGIPIKYLKDLTKIVSVDEKKIVTLLKEVDFILS